VVDVRGYHRLPFGYSRAEFVGVYFLNAGEYSISG